MTPTIASLAGINLPKNEIDGKNVTHLITNKSSSPNPHRYYALSMGKRLEAILSSNGRWKLHLPHSYKIVPTPGMDGQPGANKHLKLPLSLFDLKNDPKEAHNVIEKHPKIAEQLQRFAQEHLDKFYQK